MAVKKAQKSIILQEIAKLLENTKSIAVSDYKGINVENTRNLRIELRKEDISLKVAKKTLINKALVDKGFPELPDSVMGTSQVAIAISRKDEVAPFRMLQTLFKKLKMGKLLGGMIDGEVFEADKAMTLATLPSKEILIAKMIGGFKAPINKFHGVLSGTLSGFVRVLNAIKDKKPA